ncbi:Protogenin B [Merluccius polli]|uniref:Protogenin B n=1 Tax=Merluccius polli TaxID=89951 RepID=A0AA47NYD2_MERPO|nr:Protogenin B [Merluccius polli]
MTLPGSVQGQYGGGNQKKTSGTLHVTNVTQADGGVYMCVTHNPLFNASQRSAKAVLTVLGVPRGLQITQGPATITVATGTEAVMRCAVHGHPVPMVHWFKDSHLLTNLSASLRWRDNGQLLVFRFHTCTTWTHCTICCA